MMAPLAIMAHLVLLLMKSLSLLLDSWSITFQICKRMDRAPLTPLKSRAGFTSGGK
jgi:hypothetical protein